MNKYLGGLILAPALVLGSAPVMADKHGMGMGECTVEIKRTEVSFIITIGGGEGTLTCKDGVRHDFRVGGLKVGASGGIAKSDMVGTVTGLKTLTDFNGTYSETKAQASVAKGSNVMDLANSKGVMMSLRGKSGGFDVQLAAGGMKVTLE